MTFTKDDLKQHGTSPTIQEEIMSIKQEIADIKVDIARIERRLDWLFEIEPDDVLDSYIELEKVKKRVAKLDQRVATLER